MPDQGIFTPPADQATSSTTPSTTTSGNDDSDVVATLVGEGRKYKTMADLAKAYMNADNFIEQLKTENSDLREKANKAKTIDDVLQRLEASRKPNTSDQGGQDAQKGALSAGDVEKIVKDTLTGLETARSRQDNLLKADAKMKQLFGDKAAEVFQNEAKTPELRAALTNLAQVDPEKFVQLFTKQPAQTAVTTTASTGTSTNTAALGTTPVGTEGDPATKAYFDVLRKKDPKKYYSAEVQLQMQTAAIANPDKFFGRSRS